jgi:Pentapeptide repeats (8 copies)
MVTDPKDVAELQKALNDTAGKASVLWTTFITFQLYLAIAFGSVTHRDLFLEAPIKLPLLNVDLPLVGFFVLAPILLVIFHFYVFLQLLGLAAKAEDYNMLLASEALVASDRRYLRHRLDSFVVLQVLAGPSDQRTGFGGMSSRLIVWITLVGTPVLILLQAEVTFLPYHRAWVLWLQRITVLIDLVMIWYFWGRLRGDADPLLKRVPRTIWMSLGVGASLAAVIFGAFVATFPGEWADKYLPDLRYIPTTLRPHWSLEDNWTSLQDLLFKGAAIDEISGRPRSLFANRLVLTDQSFVVDPGKLDQVDVSRSFRGRDLNHAVLSRADLRKADFTGAIMNGARF